MMSDAKFWTGLGLTTLGYALIGGLLYFLLEDLQGRLAWMVALPGFYIFLSWMVYFTASRAAQHPNPVRLLQYTMGLTFVKMALSLAFMYVYFSWTRPSTLDFLWPFLTAYLLYTIFVSWVLFSLNKASAPKKTSA